MIIVFPTSAIVNVALLEENAVEDAAIVLDEVAIDRYHEYKWPS